MPCPHCDAELKPEALFCHRCGRRLKLPAVDTVVEPPVPPVVEDIAAAETRELVLESLHAAPLTNIPLAQGAVIGERYRVERVVFTSPSWHRYAVLDLLAGTRCWACQAGRHADDAFCPSCGAQRRIDRLFIREEPAHPERIAALNFAENENILDGDRLFLLENDGEFEHDDEVAIEEETEADGIGEGASDRISPHQPEQAGRWVDDETETVMTIALAPSPEGETVSGVDTVAVMPHTTSRPPRGEESGWIREQNEAPTIEATFYGITISGIAKPGSTPQIGSGPRILTGTMSDAGRARRNKPNEDTALILALTHAGDATPTPLTLCIVADGLGGHDDGQRAGRLAVRIIASHVIQTIWLPALEGVRPRDYDPITLGDALRGGILEANTRIVASNVLEGGDMGCTVTAFIAQGESACIANVGDSRTYHFDGEELHRVTIDHSLVARLVAARMLDPEDVYTHPQRSQIYRSLGDETDLQVDLFPRRLRPGDQFILCSDGLWEMVHDPTIHEVILAQGLGQPQATAEALVMTANTHGGDDNVTVIVAQVVT